MRETEMKALTGNHPRKYAPGVRVDAFDELDTVDDAGLDSSFMCSDPVAEDLAAKVGAVDRSLVAVLDQIAADDAPNDDFERGRVGYQRRGVVWMGADACVRGSQRSAGDYIG